MLSGSDILAMIERLLDDTRRELEGVDTRLARGTAELERLRQSELGVLGVLARVRLREIEGGELQGALDETGRQVTELLAQRGVAQAAVGVDLAAAQEVLDKLGRERTAQQAVVAAAAEALDAAEAEAQKSLTADAAYRARLEAAEASDRIADLAEAKAQAANTDRVEKGKPYEADPLFAYLWACGYGTSRYGAGPFTRLLDGWVARVADFEPLRRNYWMLTEMPARFNEHAQRMRALADQDVGTVRDLEHAAAATAGVPERESTLTAAEDAQAAIDQKIEAQQTAIATLVEKRAAFAAGEDDLSRRCTQVLSDALRAEKMRTLRDRANLTPSPDDDAAVDELTAIRADTPRLEDEVSRYRTLHDTHADSTNKLEEVRKRFKEKRYDAVTSEFVNGALIATLLTQLLAGSLGVGEIWDALSKQQRHRNLGADPRFGSGRFPRGPGRPPWGGGWGGGGWGGGGGFGKGGGFGGGGFGKGGGFGGGGFKTGGRF